MLPTALRGPAGCSGIGPLGLHYNHWLQKGDEGLPSIILVGQGLLLKMLIILKLHGIF